MRLSKKTLSLISIVAAMTMIGAMTWFIVMKARSTNNTISATVIGVIDKPNVAEDGYYGITVRDASGRQYKINATGYLNTPAQPDQFDESCVNIPKVKVGDKLLFNLPKSKNQSDTFKICYPRGSGDYFLTLE